MPTFLFSTVQALFGALRAPKSPAGLGGPSGPPAVKAVTAVKAVAAVGGPNWELQLPIRSSNIYILEVQGAPRPSF